MKCSVNGCRICPGMWVAAALLLFSLVQSVFFPRSAAPNAAPAATVGASQEASGDTGATTKGGTGHVADAE